MDNIHIAYLKTLDENVNPYDQDVNKLSANDNCCVYLTGPKTLKILNLNTTTRQEVCIPDDLPGNIVHIKYLTGSNTVFLTTDVSLAVFDITEKRFSSTSYVDPSAKIVNACVSPAENSVVVIDDKEKLTLFSVSKDHLNEYHFNCLANTELHRPVPNSVYVGWGATNTQFKGVKKQEEIVKEIPQEYSLPTFSWRGNGEMFVINYWKDQRRFLKVFNSDMYPLHESEPYNNLLPQTSFKGQGNAIACAATDGISNRIVIFEKNCLVKSSFEIPENKGNIKDIQYHGDKHLLAVHSQSSDEICLNIYSYANDTWHLKQQFLYRLSEGEALLKFEWVSDLSECKLATLDMKHFSLYHLQLAPYGVHNDLLAVINGLKVLFTDFSKAVMPPPMSDLSLEFTRPVVKISYYLSENVYGFHLSDRSNFYFKYEKGAFTNYNDFQVVPVTPNHTYNFELKLNGFLYVIELTNKQELVVNSKIMVTNVLSINVHNNYLLFTHASMDTYKLSCVRLTEASILTLTPEICLSREVEQGAKIICVTKKDQIILAMPRGNLETITCRLIAIDAIESLLSKNEWKVAIANIRHQKLNWNLLIDLDKDRFNSRLSDFCTNVSSPALQIAILADFETENCLETMYKDWPREVDRSKLTKREVLENCIKYMIATHPIDHLMSIVILYSKHFSIKLALMYILQKAFLQDYKKEAGIAITYILRHHNSTEIISCAYTLYDIEFLKFLLSFCLEDPKIFQDDLNGFAKLHPIERRFIMSVRGMNYINATKYLVRSEHRDSAFICDFIRKHETYAIAYYTLDRESSNFLLVSKLYAVHLALKNKHNESGMVLERAGLLVEALDRYKFARNWQKVLNLLDVLKVDKKDKMLTLSALAQNLAKHDQVEDGVLILEYYCCDYDGAIRVLVENNLFQKAIFLARQYNKTETIEKLIGPSLKRYTQELSDRLSEINSKYDSYTLRLKHVRKMKFEKLLKFQEITNAHGTSSSEISIVSSESVTSAEGREHFESSNFSSEDEINSEYGSLISQTSSRTLSSQNSTTISSMSSRKRRKLAKKKIDIKEGGIFEDIALIRQLYLLTMDLAAIGDKLVEISNCLFDEEHFKFCKKLHRHFEFVQKNMSDAVSIIWSPDFLSGDSADPNLAPVIGNREELDEQFRIPPVVPQTISSWLHFKGEKQI